MIGPTTTLADTKKSRILKSGQEYLNRNGHVSCFYSDRNENFDFEWNVILGIDIFQTAGAIRWYNWRIWRGSLSSFEEGGGVPTTITERQTTVTAYFLSEQILLVASQNICMTFVQCWTNVEDGWPTLSQQTQNMCMTFVQRRPNVFDVGPTLYKCHADVLCLLEYPCECACCYHYHNVDN